MAFIVLAALSANLLPFITQGRRADLLEGSRLCVLVLPLFRTQVDDGLFFNTRVVAFGNN